MLLSFAEEVCHGEVVELQTDAADDTCLSPSERELYLVVRLLHEVPVDVNRAVFVVWLHIGIHLLSVEVSHGSYFTRTSLQGILGKEVARLGTQLASDDVLVQTVVTHDAYAADMSLRALLNAHFQVDAVADDVHFGRLQVVEQVTVVPVEVAHGVVVLRESLVHVLLVVDVAFLHAQHIGQMVGVVDGVSHPSDVPQIVFLPLVHLYIYIDVLVVEVPDAVFQNGGIAVSVLVVFVNQVLFVFLPALRCELLLLQEGGEFVYFVYVLEGTFGEKLTLDFRVRELFVTLDDDLVHLHLFLLVHGDVQNHLILVRHIVALHDVDVSILVTFVVEILLCEYFRAVNHVRSNLAALEQTQFLLHVLAFRLFQTDVVDGRDAWPDGQMDVEIDFLADERVSADGHSREQAVLPVSFHGIRDLRSRDGNMLSYL